MGKFIRIRAPARKFPPPEWCCAVRVSPGEGSGTRANGARRLRSVSRRGSWVLKKHSGRLVSRYRTSGVVGVGVRSIPVTVPGFGNSRPGRGFDPARTLCFCFLYLVTTAPVVNEQPAKCPRTPCNFPRSFRSPRTLAWDLRENA